MIDTNNVVIYWYGLAVNITQQESDLALRATTRYLGAAQQSPADTTSTDGAS